MFGGLTVCIVPGEVSGAIELHQLADPRLSLWPGDRAQCLALVQEREHGHQLQGAESIPPDGHAATPRC